MRWIQTWRAWESEQHSLRSSTTMSLPPPRRTGPGVQHTLSERLPLTPRNPNAPYVRPPPRYPTDANAAATRPGGGPGRTSESQNDDVSQKILDEVRRVRDEQKCMREEVRRTSQLVSKLEEEYKKLTDQLKQQEEASFSIESSVYKVSPKNERNHKGAHLSIIYLL